MKRKMASKVLSLLLMLCMVVGLLPGMTITAGATGHTTRTSTLDIDTISADNLQGATLDNGVYTNSAEGWTWDSNTKTLTLSGCTIDVQGENPAVNLPDGAIITTAADTQNTLSSGSTELYAALVGMGEVTINGSGSISFSGYQYGLSAGEITVNAPITAIATKQGGMAVYGGKITINSALRIMEPSGGKIVEGKGYYIADSSGNAAARVVIGTAAPTFDDGLGNADCAFGTYTKGAKNDKGYTFAGWFNGKGEELTSASAAQAGSTYTAKWTKNGKTVRTTPLDFYDDSASDEWKTGCT